MKAELRSGSSSSSGGEPLVLFRRVAWLGLVIAALVLSACAGNHVKQSAPAGMAEGRPGPSRLSFSRGAVVRGPADSKRLALLFTGHEFAEGGTVILDELASRRMKASFFVTGAFLSNPEFAPLVRRILREGHYIGPHSDKHLLYCSWDSDRKLLVTHDEFTSDLHANLKKLAAFGVSSRRIRWFIPPYEHYNEQIVAWSAELGLRVANFTPGTRSTADYTGEAETNFVSSDTIFRSIVDRHSTDPHGLNGHLLLLHLGAGPGRGDKFHTRFGALLDFLTDQGYECVRVDSLLGQ